MWMCILHRQRFIRQPWLPPLAPGFLSFGGVIYYTSKFSNFFIWFDLS